MNTVTGLLGSASDLNTLRDLILASEQPMEGVALLPEGYKLESLERFQESPQRMRGVFEARSIEQFTLYTCLNAESNKTAVFVDEEKLAATAILGQGSPAEPGWGSHRAILRLKRTPEWTALGEAAKTSNTQAGLIDFITEWSECLSFSAAPIDQPWSPMTAAQAIVALRKIKTAIGRDAEHVEQDQQRSRTVFERAAIDSAPPPTMRWIGKPADELEERQITLRLIYLPQDPPIIKLRIVGQERLIQAIGNEFLELVSESITDDIRAHIGTFSS